MSYKYITEILMDNKRRKLSNPIIIDILRSAKYSLLRGSWMLIDLEPNFSPQM